MYRVLFVDDEEIIVQGLVELIEGQSLADVEVCSAYSANEALAIMRQSTVDIVVTDIEMPRMNGLELQKEIRKQWPRCKVIILTGYDEFAYAHEAIRNQGFDYLLKTESDETIIQTIQNALADLAARDQLEELIANAKLPEVAPVSSESGLIDTVREYIKLHLAEDLSLAKIAEVVSLSPSYLSRVYKQTTGNGLSEDIADIRLKKSIEMLKQPHYRMHEISSALGFVSDNYFYRFFKKHMKVTPQEFRASLQRQ